ncbi:hypothetical protein PR202_ga17220 [Eleusine coracana subsp. coracana]|uniref:Uncharacterized protein n=1 Tax=Eleusine coracana subsp. coracana TaxID=191504 RepID=A0AAV5CPW9_ELECO|nr:hypothetical protein PR202_ga17220 [Eleusine coracana subsp. coracana]
MGLLATINNNDEDLRVRVLSRRLIKASDSSLKPHVLAVSNLDLVLQYMHHSAVCIYPPTTTHFDDVVAVFESGLPSLLSPFYPFAGRMAANPSSGLPEVHCNNQGAELVIGEAGVSLGSLDYSTMTASLRKMPVPYGEDDLALSVQLVSFACGGFAVVWRTNHVLADGSALALLVRAWAELARNSSRLPAGSWPHHDRSIFRPRSPPSYSASSMLTILPDDYEQRVPQISFVERLYRIEASDIASLQRKASYDDDKLKRATRVQAISAYLWKAHAAAADHTRCRMAWRVNGRWQLTTNTPAAMQNYVGNVLTMTVREAGVQEVMRMPLPDVAAMVRDTITGLSYDHHFQELVDWVEDHKATNKRFAEMAILGLGCPTLRVSAMSSFQLDSDFGFGRAALGIGLTTSMVRLGSGSVQIFPGLGNDGSWIVSALVWPRLAAQLENANPCILKPLTAADLGLLAPQLQRSRI